MEDDHVDRPGVEAQQCVKLTGTNRSIGLIALMVHVRGQQSKRPFVCLPIVLRRSGDLSEAPEPDPIPNSAVKRLSANGTVSQDPGE